MSQSTSLSVQRSTVSPAEAASIELPTQSRGFPSKVLSRQGWQVFLAQSIQQIPRPFWSSLVNKDAIFWSREYLYALEQELPSHMEVRYLMFVHQRRLVAASMVQLFDLKLDELGSSIEDPRRRRLLNWVPGIFARRNGERVLRIMMAGDIFHTGAPGILHHADVTLDESLQALNQAMRWLEKRETRQGRLARQVVKDFAATPATERLTGNGYFELQAEPEMNLVFRDNWSHYDHYLADMSSKYRQRARSARKKGKELTTRLLNEDEVEAHCHELQELLDAVIGTSSFHLAHDRVNLYCRLKRHLGDRYVFRVYELEWKLVGFSTYLLDGKALVAHRVGIDYSVNQQVKLYQNMLYDFIQAAFDEGAREVQFGRTALEIKSTVGAEPQTLTFYLRHPRFWMNMLVQPFLNIVPPTDWVQRRPFKEYPGQPEATEVVKVDETAEDTEGSFCPIHRYCSISSLLKTVFSCPKNRS